MNFEIEDRKRQLEAFSTFIDESYKRIDDMLQSVGWSREFLTNENSDMVACPLNPEHRIPKKSLDAHVELCSWRQEGYHKQDIPLPENPIKNYENTKSSIVIDAELQAKIIQEAKDKDSSLQTGNLEDGKRLVPKTSDRLTADFTSDERRILYDFVVSKTTPVEDLKVEDLQFIGDMKRDDQPRPKSKLELLIEQRDAKRRRISYKKKVHTNRKTHTEILREVIQNQMDLYEQIVTGECDDEAVGDDKDEIFSLGGDEVNILPSRSKSENKSCHEMRVATDVSEKERSSDRKVTEKEIGKYGSVPEHERYSRTEQKSENWMGKPEASLKYEKNSYERRKWNEGHKSFSSSSSLGEKPVRDRYYGNESRGDRSRDYRPYNRDKNRHHRSRTNSEEYEEYRQYSKTSSKQDESEYRKQYYSHSKYMKYSSKRENSEVYLEEERETESQTKRYKYSSKYSSCEHDQKHERKYEVTSHKNNAGSYKGDFTNDRYDVLSKEFRREDDYDNSKSVKGFNDWSSEHREVKLKVENDEMSPEIRKNSKKVKKSKKKKKKNHKHKSKKKYKRKKSDSSGSSASSQSSSEDSGSNSS